MNKVLVILVMSKLYKRSELARIFRRNGHQIAQILKGAISIREDDEIIDKGLIERLGFNLCGCCEERVIIKNPEPEIELSRICIYCFKTVSTEEENPLHLPITRRYMV